MGKGGGELEKIVGVGKDGGNERIARVGGGGGGK